MNENCRFRTEGQQARVYEPGDIEGYGLADGRRFVAETVNERPFFLEQLTSGRVSLYYYRDELGDHYLIDKAGLGLSQLEYRESEKWVNGKRIASKSRSHLLLLNYYLQDWPDAPQATEDLGGPRHDNLIRLLENYHAAVSSNDTFEVLEQKMPLIVLTPEVVAGYTRYAEVPEMKTDNYSRVGALAHIWMPRVNRKLYFRTGVLYSQLDLYGTTRTYYKFPVQLEYVYPSEVFRPSFAYGPNFTNIIAGTVSGNLGAMVRLGNRTFLTAGYEIEFEEEYLIIPVQFLSQSVSVGIAVRLNGR